MRILVVEDEAIVGKGIQASLIRCGHSVDPVLHSGESLIEALRERSDTPDLIVLDTDSGGGWDGIEVGAAVREEFGIPVLFVSATSDAASLRRARDAGAYGFLMKPFNERELHSMVEIAAARHASESMLQEENARYLGALRSMAISVIATDLVGRVTFINPAAETITGWSSELALGRYVHEIFRISHASGEAVAAGDATSGDGRSRSVMLTARDGELVQIHDNTMPLRDPDGGLCGLVITFRAVDEAEDATARLIGKNREGGDELTTWAHMAGMVRGIADPIVAVDPQWKITYVNEPIAELLATSRRDLFGADFWSHFPQSARSRYYQPLHQALSRNEPTQFELQLDAPALWFHARCYPFANGLLILLSDITAQKDADERQAKFDKLESLGFLARGFAHDFNNLLTVLLGNLSIAGMRAPDDAPYRDEIDEAKRATLQAQALVHQLLIFAKGGAPILRRVEIGTFLKRWFGSHQRKEGVSYSLDIQEDIGSAEIDPDQCGRLLSNIVLNSEQALADTGTIVIRARRIEGEDEASESSSYLEWIIKDTGHGITPEDSEHVFEPYFSTRREANASGIGLTVCESIAKAHHGTITLDSAPDQGTTVVVKLPTSAPEPVAGNQRKRRLRRSVPQESRGNETSLLAPVRPNRQKKPRILILEDERLIRQLLALNLTAGGYSVEATEEGSQAIAAFKSAHESGKSFDLFITDLTIPDGMGGADAMEQILSIDPDVRAIVSSGYSDDPVMSRYRDYGFSAVLPKPYEPRQLLELVEEVIDAP